MTAMKYEKKPFKKVYCKGRLVVSLWEKRSTSQAELLFFLRDYHKLLLQRSLNQNPTSVRELKKHASSILPPQNEFYFLEQINQESENW